MNPKKPAGEKAKGIGLSLTPDIQIAGKAMAKIKGQSFSAFVRDLIKDAQKNCENAGAEKERSGKRKVKSGVSQVRKATGQEG